MPLIELKRISRKAICSFIQQNRMFWTTVRLRIANRLLNPVLPRLEGERRDGYKFMYTIMTNEITLLLRRIFDFQEPVG